MLSNLNLTRVDDMNLDSIQAALAEASLPYEVSRKKNPLFKWEYLEVKKSAVVGIWIREMDKKGEVALIPCIPSALARAFFGGLIFMILFKSARGEVAEKLAGVLRERFPGA